MKTTPMLFNSDMVRALLDGRKTMTRRNYIEGKYSKDDLIWVKETHFQFGYWLKSGLTKTGRDKYDFYGACPSEIKYFENDPGYKKNSYRKMNWYKRNSLFMKRGYSRLTLKITDMRVERVQDISEQDAIAEGAIEHDVPIDRFSSPNRWAFSNLWDSINNNWDQNPWVYVIEFEVIKQNVDEYLNDCRLN